ncbi:hypothetical protein SEPCBS57363_002622 [Sporothrix epigloea]|uniref:Uncharacterized protein n=1 Tax=Sporothrix epigloea TaxID=1892477 RepID=A0ABP0DH58_9PEZI
MAAMLRKSREIGALEQTRQAFDKLDERRQKQQRALLRRSDFPSLLELNRPMSEAELAQREDVTAKINKIAKDLDADTKNFLVRLDSWLRPESTKGAPLQGLNDVRSKLATVEKQNSDSVTTVQQENAKLRGEVKGLTGLVEEMGARLAALEKKSADFTTQQGKDSVRLAMDLSRIEKMESKVADYSAIFAKVESVDLESLNSFITNEMSRQQETSDKQEVVVAALKKQMGAVQSDLQAVTKAQTELKGQQQRQHAELEASISSALASALASVPAPASASAPASAASVMPPPLLFPGDDFPSLRMDISELNEKTDKLESRHKSAISAIAKNTIDLKKLQDESQKDRMSWTSMSKTFGELLDQETRGRLEDSNRLKELETLVRQPQQLSTASHPVPTGTEVALIETSPRPPPSQLPKTIEPTDSVGSESGVLSTAIMPVGFQTTNLNSFMENNRHREGGIGPQDLEIALQADRAQIKLIEDSLQALRLDCYGQLSSLRMMVTTLDSQIYNITSRELFQAIIGHIEKLFPSPRQMQEDIRNMANQLSLMNQSSPTADKGLLQIPKDNKGLAAGPPKRASGDALNDGNAEGSASTKRQRVDVARQPSNGGLATSDSSNDLGIRPASTAKSVPVPKTAVPKAGTGS